ncbi:MAG: InlB B-repeat-containing protein [Bryobacteraceae bacterium]
MKNCFSQMARLPFAQWLLRAALAGALAAAAWAQSSSVTTITPVPAGANFTVDGQNYSQPTSFTWPAGSAHIVAVPNAIQNGALANTQLTYVDIAWAGGTYETTSVIITADPSITKYTVNFAVAYALTISFYSCGGGGPCSGSPGSIVLNNGVLLGPWDSAATYSSGDVVTYGSSSYISLLNNNTGHTPPTAPTYWGPYAPVTITSSQQIYLPAGSPAVLQAFPNEGFVFTGWSSVGAGETVLGYQITVAMNGPMSVYPGFAPAVTVNLVSVPSGLQILADHNAMYTPALQYWGWNTVHTVGVISPQTDSTGNPWVFSSWSDGGLPTHGYTVPSTSLPVTVTATFIPGAAVSFFTSPTGLNLIIDGRGNWPSPNFIWGVGDTHTFSAPVQQTDSQGRIWAFNAWSNGGPASQTLVVPASATVNGMRLTATYTPVGQATITSAAAASVLVNGTACALPCNIQQAVGSVVTVSAPASVPLNAASREDFLGWSTGATGDLTYTLTASPTTISANYHLMNLLATSATPAGGASWTLAPTSSDGFYDSGTTVNVSVAALAGYRFLNFSGDLGGAIPSGQLAMSVPRSVQAVLSKVPYLSPSGVINAAGVTPLAAVAPGSVVSVFGLNLAPNAVSGPTSPMVQTLGSLTVTLGNRVLPLFFVSPTQINFLLPADAATGAATLTVSIVGQPDTTAPIAIAQDAPGIFGQSADGQTFAVAFHDDGTQVTAGSPAVAGETVTVYGTGFGPTNTPRPYGMPAPSGILLTDPIAVQLNDQTVTPAGATVVAGAIGIDSVAFAVPAGLPPASNATITITVNGQVSNSVSLPLQ